MTRRYRTILTIAIYLLVLVVVPGWFLTLMVISAQLSAKEAAARCAAKQTWIALACYHEHYGCYPPAYTVDSEGRRQHSWRILVSPWADLAKEYRYDEAWDSEANRRFIDETHCFRDCSRREDDHFTYLVAVVGPNTAFPGTASRSDSELSPDTILLVLTGDFDIIWTEPRDITPDDVLELFRQYKQRYYSWKSFINPVGRGPCVVLADGSVTYLHHEMTEEYIRSVLELPPDPLDALAADAAANQELPR